MSQGLTHDAAYDYCEQYGMKLAVIDSDLMQQQIFNMSLSKFGKIVQYFWVDGKFKNGRWYSYSYGETPAFSGLIFKQTPITVKQRLAVSSLAYGGHKYAMDGCAKTHALMVLCEILV
jgi:hypothetical protein